MAGIFHRLSLYLLMIALALAPLRGALALTAPDAVVSADHCKHGMHSAKHPACNHAMPDGRNGGHDCKRGCCAAACTCASAPAITASPRTAPLIPASARPAAALAAFSQRVLPPPFRPPVSCAS